MRKIIILLLSVLTVALSANAQQQEAKKWKAPKRPKVKWVAPKQVGSEEVIDVWRPYGVSDNWFVDVYGGSSASMAEHFSGRKIWDIPRGMGGFAIGKRTSYLFGTSLSFDYVEQNGWIADFGVQLPESMKSGGFSYKMARTFLDERVSLLKMMCRYNERRRMDVQLFAGVGMAYSFGFSKNCRDWEKQGAQYKVDRTDHINLAIRGGLDVSYMVAPQVDVFLRGTYNMIGDTYNGVKHSNTFAFDKHVDAMLGVTMYIQDNYGDYRYKKVHRSQASSLRGQSQKVANFIENEKNELLRDKEKNEIVDYGKLMRTHISFYTDRAFVNDDQMENVRIVADFLKNHPEVNVVIRGYSGASRSGESPDMQLAERRVAAVEKALVRYYNVDQSRFSTWFDEQALSPFPMQGEWIDAVVFEMVRK